MRFLKYMAVAALMLIIVLIVSAVKNAREAALGILVPRTLEPTSTSVAELRVSPWSFSACIYPGAGWYSGIAGALLLPFLEYEAVYDQYRFDEPWNGPNNRKLASSIYVEMFQCPSGPDHGRTFNTDYDRSSG